MRSGQIAAVVVSGLCLGSACRAATNDWAGWRGPGQDGVSMETGLPSTWSPDGENLVWSSPVGGRSTPIIMDGHVYVFTNVGTSINEQERLVCLDADSGRILWEHRFPVFLTDIVSNRLGWSSPAGDPETGNVYVHGTGGLLICLNRSGKVVWERPLYEELGRVSGYGGRLHTPLVDEDLVILSFLNSSWGPHTRGSHRYVAFDKRDGKIVWWSQPGGQPLDTTYACPVVAVINGQRLLIAPNADGAVHALKVRTGEKVWTFRLSKRGLNVSPVVSGNRVYVAHSEENLDTAQLGRIVCIDATGTGDVTQTHEAWRADGVMVGYCSLALHDGRLYAIDNSANLMAIDADTGKEVYQHNLGTVGKGSPVWADGKVYVGEVNGRFHIVRVGEDGAQSLDVEEFKNPNGTVVEIFGSPAVANGRVYFMTRNALYCIGSRDASPSQPVPRTVTIEPAAGTEIKKLLVVPGEVTIEPGQSVSLTVRAYDGNGRYIRDVDASWVLPTPPPPPPAGPMAGTPRSSALKGTISTSGTFTADANIAFQAGAILARVGDLVAVARVRVSAPLPFTENFDQVPENGVPGGWVGVAGKCRVVTLDGQKVFKKLALSPSPPFARVRGRIGMPVEAGYTVAADVMGVNKGPRFFPDMGLINSRYKLILVGTTVRPKLRVVAWDPMPRLQEEVDFAWKPKTWYRAKFSVDLVGGQARLRGKVWPRDEAEPTAWTIEAMDPTPHVEGSPGLYAYSTGVRPGSPGTEVFFDNLEVTRN